VGAHLLDPFAAELPERAPGEPWPDQPVLVRLWRGGRVESQHRGAWVVAEACGAVVDGQGDWNHPVFPRSATKSFQALPLIETGAAERFGFTDAELALALASHHAEPIHVRRVSVLLERLGLGIGHLQCGTQAPVDGDARRALVLAGERPTAVHNNCSGKHAGFLALALHLGIDPARYLDPDLPPQRLVRRAVEEMTGARPGELSVAIDGCSAPTFHLPLVRLAAGIARVANPEGLPRERRSACERLTAAAALYPELIGGTRRSLCTDLLRASGGKVFPKTGTEAVYVAGIRGAGRGLAVKIDDGSTRAMHALVSELLVRFGFLAPGQTSALAEWRAGPVRNWAGTEVGRLEIVA
jgi:L-asparaginase II